MLNQLDKWHKTRSGYFVFAAVELAAAYWLISLAIDRGNPLYYLGALIFLVEGLRNLFKLLSTLLHGNKT